MNIIVISLDQLRYDSFGFTGNQQVFTPNIDRLAFDSWVYSNHYSSASESLCNKYDIFNNTIGLSKTKNSNVSLFDNLQNHHTHLLFDTPQLPIKYPVFMNSFNSWMSIRGSYTDNYWCYDDIELPENWEYSKYYDDIIEPDNNILFSIDNNLKNYAHSNRLREKEEEWITARLFLLAGQFLKDNASRKDLFLWIDCAGMNDLWEAPPEILKLYQSTKHNGNIDPRIFLIQQAIVKKPSISTIDLLLACYYARITFIDRWIGILLKTISAIGITDNTAIMITSMNGHYFPLSSLASFNQPETASHIPLVLKIPGTTHHKDITPVSSSAIYNLISRLANNSITSPADAYTGNSSTIICAASPEIQDDFYVTDGINYTHYSEIGNSTINSINETAVKFRNHRKSLE